MEVGVIVLVLITYDVSTETAAGRRRLRRVARVCLNHGQRVQKSVFECRVNQAQFEALERKLLAEIELSEDNLRFYRLTEPCTTIHRRAWYANFTRFNRRVRIETKNH